MEELGSQRQQAALKPGALAARGVPQADPTHPPDRRAALPMHIGTSVQAEASLRSGARSAPGWSAVEALARAVGLVAVVASVPLLFAALMQERRRTARALGASLAELRRVDAARRRAERLLERADLETRKLRQQLTHLARAAALGQLSGAFAHELNQPLSSILGNAETGLRLLEHGTSDPAEIREILRDIVRDDERAAQTIQRLSAMLRNGGIQRHPVDLNAVTREVLHLARSDLTAHNVSVETELDPRAPLVLADRVQMQQVMLNLIMNACEAMAGMAAHERKLRIVTCDAAERRCVELRVQDVGCGIAPGEVEHIFEPFVTTKNNGLGLGLAICRSIAHTHGGRLWAENAPGRGAILHLSMPVEGVLQ